jgi:hypothetical protein
MQEGCNLLAMVIIETKEWVDLITHMEDRYVRFHEVPDVSIML